MNIIVVGCGKVGRTLVEQLSTQNHNIVIIDEREEKINKVTDEIDAKGIIGNGVSNRVLLEAGIKQAHLLIAVTGSDEQNLLCCVIAKKTGRCKTIARVRNPIYFDDISFIREELGLSMIINPELTCANEIARLFQFPSAVKIETFSKGRIELLHFNITADCGLNNLELMHVRSKFNSDVLVCMVKRDDELIIPRGDFVFREGDVAAIVSTPANASAFFKKIGINTNRINTVMLIGAGTLSYYLARRLLSVGIQTKILDMDPVRCEQISEQLPKATVICGDVTDQKVLLQEGLPAVNGFAALTGLDEENILLSLYAKSVSQAKCVTKINRTSFSSVLSGIHLDTITYPILLTADTISKFVRSMDASPNSNVENLYQLEGGLAEALEFYIKEESAVTGVPLGKLKIKKNVLVCCITRGRQFIIPRGHDELQVGDLVIVVTRAGIHDISDILEK